MLLFLLGVDAEADALETCPRGMVAGARSLGLLVGAGRSAGCWARQEWGEAGDRGERPGRKTQLCFLMKAVLSIERRLPLWIDCPAGCRWRMQKPLPGL